MDNIDLFVDHFVIHSKNREALILNASSSEEFKQELRNLIKMNNHQIALEELKTLYKYIEDIEKNNPHDVVRLVVSTFTQRLEWVINKLESNND